MYTSTVSFHGIMDRLGDHTQPFPAKYLHYFSDLSGEPESLFEKSWNILSVTRKLSLLDDLDDLGEHDTLMDFTSVGKTALSDEDEQVREAALRLIWECEDKSLVPTVIKLLEDDPSARVRATAASLLGHFVFMGETDALSEALTNRIIDGLLEKYKSDTDKLVRRRALESLGYSSRPEIGKLITQAATNKDTEWLASSLYAMGRSADPAWSEIIRNHLGHPEASVREEAVRAAGELELRGTREALLTFLDEEEDDDVLGAIIWSLSQIGGEGVRGAILNQIEIAQDDEITDYFENALENLDFTEELAQFKLLDIENGDDSLS